jgi:DNA-3-methyladenine glycosylase
LNSELVLGRNFYDRRSSEVAKDLVGKILVRVLESDGRILEGIIVETEAYGGMHDPASHAYRGKTKRNEVMIGPPGRAYVYFIYGFHYCLNIVTNPGRSGAGAVLIRAAVPLSGIDTLEKNRGTKVLSELASGPGKLCQAFEIDLSLNGSDVTSTGSPIYLRNSSEPVKIRSSPRIGISRAKTRKWRFYLDNSRYTSRGSILRA